MAKQNCIKKKITASLGYEYVGGKRTQIKKTETVAVPVSIANSEKKFAAFVDKERERIRNALEVERQTAKSDLMFREYAKKVAARKRNQGDVRSISEQSNTSIMDYLNTLVGNYKIKDINKEIVDMVKEEINNKPSTRGGIITDKTKYNYFSYFRSIINAAFADKYYTENPLAQVKNFSFDTEETTYLEKDELLFAMKALNEFHIKTQIEVLLELCTGTRRGEALSLRWQDIKQSNKGIYYFDLEEGFYYTKAEGYFRGKLKTKKSKRKLTIHQFLLLKLNEYKVWQDAEKEKWGDAWKGTDDYIICKDDGSNYNPDYFTKKVGRIFKNMGFADITTHSLRRSFATLADSENETTSKIADLLGQANVLVTDRNYIRRTKSTPDVSFLDSIIVTDDEPETKTPKKPFKRLKKREYLR
jgi:integrase